MLRAAGPWLCRAGTAEGRAAPRIPGLCRSAGARRGPVGSRCVGSWWETCGAWESLQGKQEGRRQPQPHWCDSKMRAAPRDTEKGVHQVFAGCLPFTKYFLRGAVSLCLWEPCPGHAASPLGTSKE